MASYTITHLTRIDGYAVVQVLEDTEIEVGQDILISSASDATFDGTHTVISTEPYELIDITDEGDLVFDWDVYYPNQAIFVDAGDNVARDTATGTVTYSTTCTWISNSDVTEWLGIDSATANDTAFITTCVSAANAWCYRRRASAGYFDSLTTVPDGSVKLGTVMYGATLYRERGSVDGYASFDQMGTTQPIASYGRILQLLGVGRPQVG
jgi:hypothetical protein